jgi:hypothetical protein
MANRWDAFFSNWLAAFIKCSTNAAHPKEDRKTKCIVVVGSDKDFHIRMGCRPLWEVNI